jgi:Cu+-exporting ATPase
MSTSKNSDDHHACCSHNAQSAQSPQNGMAKDPVCGMLVDPHTAKHKAVHDQHTYYFCSAGCRDKFVKSPSTYLADKPVPKEVPAGTIYTCPMHPEVKQVGPGSCPICGMALEPELVSADTPEIQN